MLITILTFLLILSLLVFVHEAGHFFVARKSGMKVDEFGFGFPPRLVGIQKVDGKWKFVWGLRKPMNSDATVYSINWIPLGGFVKILGENNENEDDPRSFINKPFLPRFFVLVAGVIMNVILAWVLISIGYGVGLPTQVEGPSQLPVHSTLANPQVAIAEVVPGQPADKAGIKPGDIIVNVNHQFANITSEDVHNYVTSHQGSDIVFTIKHINEIRDVTVHSQSPAAGQGPTGIALADIGNLKYPWYLAPIEGGKTVGYQLKSISTGLYHLLSQLVRTLFGLQTDKGILSQVGGPVKIAQLTGEVSKLGFIYLIQFTAFLSLNLAVLNIMPFPALDGGRILFLIIEKIRGKKNNQKIEQWVNTVGFMFLLLLMVIVTVKDIIKK